MEAARHNTAQSRSNWMQRTIFWTSSSWRQALAQWVHSLAQWLKASMHSMYFSCGIKTSFAPNLLSDQAAATRISQNRQSPSHALSFTDSHRASARKHRAKRRVVCNAHRIARARYETVSAGLKNGGNFSRNVPPADEMRRRKRPFGAGEIRREAALLLGQ
jgi:hypothetical protein